MTTTQREDLLDTVNTGKMNGNLNYCIRLEQVASGCPSMRTNHFVTTHVECFGDPEHWVHLWFDERFKMWDYECEIIGL